MIALYLFISTYQPAHMVYTRCFIKRDPFLFFSQFTQMMINLHVFFPDVAEEILIQNSATKYGS